jgi:hypothetical protein
LDLVIPHTVTATTDIRGIIVITRAATTAITGAIHITERITTLAGRTTTAAIDITNITSVIITATKTPGLVSGLSSWLGSHSKPAFSPGGLRLIAAAFAKEIL